MIDNTKEYISTAAIWFDDGKKHPFQEVYGIKTGRVIAGFRHAYIFGALNLEAEDLGIKGNTQIQGFITSYGRFVSRKEGRILAISAGQVKESELNSSTLFSEDVFKYQKNYAR